MLDLARSDFVAELRVVDRGKTQLSWIKPDGKVQKSVPKAVKDNDKDELKALKQAAKNIERMLIGQRERLDGLFLQQKQWTFTTFDQRYLSHPLVGTIARRLIWNIAEPGSPAIAAMWADGALRTRDTEVLTPTSEAVVTPWHPIDTSIDEVLAIGRGEEKGSGGGSGFKPQLAVILRPTPMQAVKEVSDHNELMPQKSTFFFPKLATGLFINPLA